MIKLLFVILYLFTNTSILTYSREINWERYWNEYSKYSNSIQKWSKFYNLDSNIVKAVISWESNWTPKARGIPPSCRGLMQVNGGSFNPDDNIRQGCSILSKNLIIFKDYYKALIGYNAGTGNAKKIIKSGKKWHYSTKVLQIAYTLSKLDHEIISKYINFKGLIQ